MSKRDDIKKAAIDEFGENSYNAASINRIIKMSGTSKGTFYHYFRDKKALYFSIIDDFINLKQSYFKKMLGEVVDKGNEFFDMMKAQVKIGAAFSRENPAFTRFGIRFMNETGPIRQEFDEKYMSLLGNSFMQVVEAGIAANVISNSFPPEFTSRVIWYIMMNFYDIIIGKDEEPSPDILETRLDMLFDFLRKGFA